MSPDARNLLLTAASIGTLLAVLAYARFDDWRAQRRARGPRPRHPHPRKPQGGGREPPPR